MELLVDFMQRLLSMKGYDEKDEGFWRYYSKEFSISKNGISDIKDEKERTLASIVDI